VQQQTKSLIINKKIRKENDTGLNGMRVDLQDSYRYCMMLHKNGLFTKNEDVTN